MSFANGSHRLCCYIQTFSLRIHIPKSAAITTFSTVTEAHLIVIKK